MIILKTEEEKPKKRWGNKYTPKIYISKKNLQFSKRSKQKDSGLKDNKINFRKKKKKETIFSSFCRVRSFLSLKKKYRGKRGINSIIHIKITPNNVFCTFRNFKRTLVVLTAGIVKLKVSKKSLKYITKFIIKAFVKKIKKEIRKKNTILYISGPIKIRKRIIRQIRRYLKYRNLLINILIKKSFNGCRAKKAKRKKRKGFRVFK